MGRLTLVRRIPTASAPTPPWTRVGPVGGLAGCPTRISLISTGSPRDRTAVAPGLVPGLGVGGLACIGLAWSRCRAGAVRVGVPVMSLMVVRRTLLPGFALIPV